MQEERERRARQARESKEAWREAERALMDKEEDEQSKRLTQLEEEVEHAGRGWPRDTQLGQGQGFLRGQEEGEEESRSGEGRGVFRIL